MARSGRGCIGLWQISEQYLNNDVSPPIQAWAAGNKLTREMWDNCTRGDQTLWPRCNAVLDPSIHLYDVSVTARRD